MPELLNFYNVFLLQTAESFVTHIHGFIAIIYVISTKMNIQCTYSLFTWKPCAFNHRSRYTLMIFEWS